jgi:hypothetical protein
MDFEAFREDPKTVAAVERKVLVISEAIGRQIRPMWVALRTSKQPELARSPRDRRYRHRHLLHVATIEAVFSAQSGLGLGLCGLQDLFEVAEGLRAREPWLGCPSLAAGRKVQHPERDLQNPTSLDVFQAAMHHRLAPLYETGMHPHCPCHGCRE